MASRAGQSTGIQSIEVGAPLLSALAAAPGPMSLTALARATAMRPSKAHKYLASFVRTGLVEQRSATGRYALGPLAVECGFAALRGIEVVDIAQDTLDALRDELDVTSSLTVWGSSGPTIVRNARNRQPVSLVVQLGMTLPLLTSSNGRVFAAYLPWPAIRPLVRGELADRTGLAARAGLRRIEDVEALLAGVRKKGFAIAPGTVQADVLGVSAPVFDHSGAVVAALTLVGVVGSVRCSSNSREVAALRAAARALSRRLGYPGKAAA